MNNTVEDRIYKVSLKIEVPFTDHSHLIGKSGENIRSVMNDTKTQVHFPDSNRVVNMAKSNQVSITGDVRNIEDARSRLRELSPLRISFDCPITGSYQCQPQMNPFVQSIMFRYKLGIAFKQPSPFVTTVIIKGRVCEPEILKAGTLILMDYLTGQTNINLPISTSLEITPCFHQSLAGENNMFVRELAIETGTDIRFPALPSNEENCSSIKSENTSNIVITGSIDGVCNARKCLMDRVPIFMCFDIETKTPRLKRVLKMLDSVGIFTKVEQKLKGYGWSITVRVAEKNAVNLYQAREEILGRGNQGDLAENFCTFEQRFLPPTPPPPIITIQPSVQDNHMIQQRFLTPSPPMVNQPQENFYAFHGRAITMTPPPSPIPVPQPLPQENHFYSHFMTPSPPPMITHHLQENPYLFHNGRVSPPTPILSPNLPLCKENCFQCRQFPPMVSSAILPFRQPFPQHNVFPFPVQFINPAIQIVRAPYCGRNNGKGGTPMPSPTYLPYQ